MEAELRQHQEDIAAVADATQALTAAVAKMHTSGAALHAAINASADAIKQKVTSETVTALANPQP